MWTTGKMGQNIDQVTSAELSNEGSDTSECPENESTPVDLPPDNAIQEKVNKPNPHHEAGFARAARHLDPTQPYRPGIVEESNAQQSHSQADGQFRTDPFRGGSSEGAGRGDFVEDWQTEIAIKASLQESDTAHEGASSQPQPLAAKDRVLVEVAFSPLSPEETMEAASSEMDRVQGEFGTIKTKLKIIVGEDERARMEEEKDREDIGNLANGLINPFQLRNHWVKKGRK